jgi:hypothetical protein
MRKPVLVILLALIGLTAAYYLTAPKAPPTPKVITITAAPATTTTATTAAPSGLIAPSVQTAMPCTMIYLKIGPTQLCAQVIYSLAYNNGTYAVQFANGVISGNFTLEAGCELSTGIQGVRVPCLATALIPAR